MHLTQRFDQESVLLFFNMMCRSIVYHTSCYSQMNNRTWKPGDANDLNEQKNRRVTYGNGFTVHNEYDPLGQLIRANDQSDTTAGTDGTTWTYEYDCGGNILNKKRYAYTTGAVGTEQETATYSYTDANWRDKLTGITTTNITGTTTKFISYDEIGNPLNDGEWTYTWENGRQLKEMEKGTDGQAGYMKVEYRYNSEGLRIQKIVTETTASGTTATTTDYILHGKNVVHMIQGSDQLHFFYDASNRPAIVEYNGTKYAYIHNLQGDIVGIIDSTGTEVVKYTYDAWGKKLAVTGTLAGSLGVINPFRYRGYVYDEETGLYYLRNRYYIQYVCRFINSDDIIKNNLFSYCCNNPVIQFDANGKEPEINEYIVCPPGTNLRIFSRNDIPNYIAYDNEGKQITVKRGQIIYNVHSYGDNYLRSFTLSPDKNAHKYYLEQGYINTVKPDSYVDYFGENHPIWREKSDAVYNIQMALFILGKLDHSAVCGEYGNMTLKAVKEFQRENSLKVDGLVGPETGNALFEAVYKSINGELRKDGRFRELF